MGDTTGKKSNLFRGWSAPNGKTNDELVRLEQQTQQARLEVNRLKEHGKQVRLHRLQALDALQTRQSTLTEILRRMEAELQGTDVFVYGDVLAEVFGERKIFAHRAIGLESLLCQFMHQMLAKQHQLKIMKKAGKDIMSMMKKHKMQFNNDFFSFEALAVQLEVSRINMEALYDDIFTSQHRILARLKNEAPKASPTNLRSSRALSAPQSVLVLPPTKTPKKTEHGTLSFNGKTSKDSDDDEGDLASAMDVLSGTPRGNTRPQEEVFGLDKKAQDQALKERREHRKSRRKQNADGSDALSVTSGETSLASSRWDPNSKVKSITPASSFESGESSQDPAGESTKKKRDKKSKEEATESLENTPPEGGGSGSSMAKPEPPLSSPGAQKRSSGHSARERRRQIEQMRLGRVVGGASKQIRSPVQNADDLSDGEDQKKARDRMRELEEIAKITKKDSTATTTNRSSAIPSKPDAPAGGKVKGRWPPS
jgi:hypothetical protein